SGSASSAPTSRPSGPTPSTSAAPRSPTRRRRAPSSAGRTRAICGGSWTCRRPRRTACGRSSGGCAAPPAARIHPCLSIEVAERPINPFPPHRGPLYHWGGLRGAHGGRPPGCPCGEVRRAPPISVRAWWRALTDAAAELLNSVNRPAPRPTPAGPMPSAPGARPLRPLGRLRLTDDVSRTLFDEYAAHRGGDRGEEETGWVLLGLRDGDDALALATLPAGAGREAGQAHVRFNSAAQALGSRVVRQTDRRLSLLGVVHTHPGSLRHPSDGDFRGDSRWVGQLRGGEGVFGIGTADARPGPTDVVAWQPQAHRQCLGELCLSWYALGHGDRAYRPLPVEVTLGPDLAKPLRPVWGQVEEHAERLDRLARQQARVSFGVVQGRREPALAVTVPLADAGQAAQILLEGKEVRYYLVRDGEPFVAELGDARVDQGFY